MASGGIAREVPGPPADYIKYAVDEELSAALAAFKGSCKRVPPAAPLIHPLLSVWQVPMQPDVLARRFSVLVFQSQRVVDLDADESAESVPEGDAHYDEDGEDYYEDDFCISF